ncbi:MAG: hypothetical protein JOZ81_08715, partial [Chloroflexi bacterium]|nr:hypothetical protein [Chloroflexota bacterium]
HWTVAFLSQGRAERVITAQQVFGRQAVQAYVGELLESGVEMLDGTIETRSQLR